MLTVNKRQALSPCVKHATMLGLVGSGVPQILAIQGLRAVAALAVLHVHLWAGSWLGGAGVDLFFVISGFVMVYSSAEAFGAPKASGRFFVRRLIRIVPLYWLVTLFALLIGTTADWNTIVTSFLFIPHMNEAGHFHPVVVVGWTLNWEMMFYAIFGCALFLPRRVAIIAVAIIIVSLVLIGRFFNPPSLMAYWGNPIMIEFVFGCLLGLLYLEDVRLPRAYAIGLVAAGCAALMLWAAQFGGELRFIMRGIPAAAILAGACMVATPWTFGQPINRVMEILGDASYALYLTHLFVASYLWGQPRVLVALAAVIVALVVHYWIETPVTKYLRALRINAARRGATGRISREVASTGPERID